MIDYVKVFMKLHIYKKNDFARTLFKHFVIYMYRL